MPGITFDIYALLLLFIGIFLFLIGNAVLLSKLSVSDIENINKKAASFFCYANVVMIFVVLIGIILTSLQQKNILETAHTNIILSIFIILIIVMCIIIFISNSVFQSKIKKIISEGSNQNKIGLNLVIVFMIINIIITIIFTLLLIYMSIIFHKQVKSEEAVEPEEP